MKNIIKNISIKIGNDTQELFKLKRCHPCSKYIGFWSGQKSRTVDDVIYCEECAKNNFKICECCDKIVNRLNTVDGKKVCSSCFSDKTSKCEECGVRKFKNNLKRHGYRDICNGCYRLLNRSFYEIDIGQSKVNSKTFVKNPNKMFCGVEIECLNGKRNANCFIKKELKDFGFSQGTDGSLSYGGVEFASVPMNGDLLFDSIEKFGQALNEKRYRVNKTCGLHIHLEVEKDFEYLKKLYLFYLRFEDMFFNMLPKSRRSTGFCKRFKSYYKSTAEDIMQVETLDKLKEMLYETKNYRSEIRYHYYKKRYCWANLHSIFYRGTLEIRSHSGTVNPSKIINWIMIHQRALEFIGEKSLDEIATMKITKKAFLEIFNRPLQNYIKRRWRTFINLEEKDLKTRAPVYANAVSLGVLNGAPPESTDDEDDEYADADNEDEEEED